MKFYHVWEAKFIRIKVDAKSGNGALRVGILQEDCPCEPQIFDPREYFRTYSTYLDGYASSQLSSTSCWKPSPTLGTNERVFVQINLEGELKIRGFVIGPRYSYSFWKNNIYFVNLLRWQGLLYNIVLQESLDTCIIPCVFF